jgi:hypothetical protein
LIVADAAFEDGVLEAALELELFLLLDPHAAIASAEAPVAKAAAMRLVLKVISVH